MDVEGVTSLSPPQYLGDVEHARRVYCRARPIQVREPVMVPSVQQAHEGAARALQRLGHRTQQRHRRQVGLQGRRRLYGRGRRRGGKRPAATRALVAAEAEAIPLAL